MPSPQRVTFSGEHLELARIAQYYNDIEASVRSYFSLKGSSSIARFAGYSRYEVEREMGLTLEEHARNTSMSVLAALEAAFRIDYLQRCYKRLRDPLSRAFRYTHQDKGVRIPLEDIFSLWKLHWNISASVISDLERVFRYRHWLAHGRYWTPKIGREYDYGDIYALAESVYDGFPFEE